MSLFLTGRPKTGEGYKYIRGGRHKRCIGSGPCKGLSGRYWTEVTIRCGAKMRLPNDECKPTGNQSISHRCHGNDEFNLSYFPPIGPHRGFSTPSHHPITDLNTENAPSTPRLPQSGILFSLSPFPYNPGVYNCIVRPCSLGR